MALQHTDFFRHRMAFSSFVHQSLSDRANLFGRGSLRIIDTLKMGGASWTIRNNQLLLVGRGAAAEEETGRTRDGWETSHEDDPKRSLEDGGGTPTLRLPLIEVSSLPRSLHKWEKRRLTTPLLPGRRSDSLRRALTVSLLTGPHYVCAVTSMRRRPRLNQRRVPSLVYYQLPLRLDEQPSIRLPVSQARSSMVARLFECVSYDSTNLFRGERFPNHLSCP